MAVKHAQDTVEKIITRYFVSVSRKYFEYKGKVYEPKPLIMTKSLVRDYTCPEGCGACCKAYSLDWLPSEKRPDGYQAEVRDIELNGKKYPMYSDTQKERVGDYCRNLNLDNGRCMIHDAHALGCDFELIRFIVGAEQNYLRTSLFGRGWNMMRVDGSKGSKCDIVPATEKTLVNILRKLDRLKLWTDYFELDTHLPDIIDWVKRGNYSDRLVLLPVEGPHADRRNKFF